MFTPVQRVGGSKHKYCSPECRNQFHSMARSFVRAAADELGFADASKAIMAYHDNPGLLAAPEPVAEFRERPFKAPERAAEPPDVAALLHPKLAIEAPA